jgi:hypothetical protein
MMFDYEDYYVLGIYCLVWLIFLLAPSPPTFLNAIVGTGLTLIYAYVRGNSDEC